jgi:hypothetical protein
MLDIALEDRVFTTRADAQAYLESKSEWNTDLILFKSGV